MNLQPATGSSLIEQYARALAFPLQPGVAVNDFTALALWL
jgi:hypothetical protein